MQVVREPATPARPVQAVPAAVVPAAAQPAIVRAEPGVAKATPAVAKRKPVGKKTKPAKKPHPLKPVQAKVPVKGRSATAPGQTKAAPESRGKSEVAPGQTNALAKPKGKSDDGARPDEDRTEAEAEAGSEEAAAGQRQAEPVRGKIATPPGQVDPVAELNKKPKNALADGTRHHSGRLANRRGSDRRRTDPERQSLGLTSTEKAQLSACIRQTRRHTDEVVSESQTGVRTFVIADVRGYSRFTEEYGDEAAARLAAKFVELVADGVEAHGGVLIEVRGDEGLAVFTSARQAIRAAVDLQARFAEETDVDSNLPLKVGIGIDSGEAVHMPDGGYRGAALNVAARLCGRAHGGEVIVSEGTSRLAGHLGGIQYSDRGRVHLKNIPDPVHILQAYSEHDAPPATNRWVLMFFGKPGRTRTLGWKLGLAVVVLATVTAASVAYLTTGDTEGRQRRTDDHRNERRPGNTNAGAGGNCAGSKRRARQDRACGDLEGLRAADGAPAERNPDGRLSSALRIARPLGDFLVPKRLRPDVGVPVPSSSATRPSARTPAGATPSPGAASSSGSMVATSRAGAPSATSTGTATCRLDSPAARSADTS